MLQSPYLLALVQALLLLGVMRLALPHASRQDGAGRLLLLTGALTVTGLALHGLANRLGAYHLLVQTAIVAYALHDVLDFTWLRAGSTALVYGLLLGVLSYGSIVAVQSLVAPSAEAAAASGIKPAAVAEAAPSVPGVTPIHTTSQDATADWKGARRRLRVEGGIRRSDVAYALVNEHIYGNGEWVSVVHDGTNYTWEVAIDGARNIKLLPLHVGPAH